MGHIGRFFTVDGVAYPRNSRVIIRTARGLEIGQIVGPYGELPRKLTDGDILRGLTIEDELLAARQAKNTRLAFEACSQRMEQLGLPVTLLDVEHLFGGDTLYFYFLGEPSPRLDALTAELAEVYESKVQFRSFAAAVAEGCGPGCGTAEAKGHGCGSCASGCPVGTACGTRRP
jgi:cell fate regulator YaaT (PSP1 superfamily)